jgi:hypothetical protein
MAEPAPSRPEGYSLPRNKVYTSSGFSNSDDQNVKTKLLGAILCFGFHAALATRYEVEQLDPKPRQQL